MTDVVNPSPVPIRLPMATLGTYAALANVLRDAADIAESRAYAAATPGSPRAELTRVQRETVRELRAVRDALRTAATEALVPRGGTGRPRCRRCGVDCPHCSAPPEVQPERKVSRMSPVLRSSPVLPELHGLDEYPIITPGPDAGLVREIGQQIDGGQKMMSGWAILAFVRAVRELFPDGAYDPYSAAQQERVAERVGYRAGSIRLSMAHLVMKGLLSRRGAFARAEAYTATITGHPVGHQCDRCADVRSSAAEIEVQP